MGSGWEDKLVDLDWEEKLVVWLSSLDSGLVDKPQAG
jgi:hypothetical protein